MDVKAAIFDMDGTLIDSLIVWDVLWSTFGKLYLNDPDFAPSSEDDKKVRTLTVKDAMYFVHDKYGLGSGGEELLEIADNVVYDFYSNKVELKSGVREFLEFFKRNGVKMCIASATDKSLLKVAMKHCDLESYFLNVFSCCDIGKGKDQPDIYLLASEFLGVGIEDTWVFEDSLTAIETATKIGMPTVGIYDRYNYGQDEMERIATEYIADGETLLKLIDRQ